MRRILRVFLWGAFFYSFTVWPASVFAAYEDTGKDWKFSSSVTYETGDFGTGTTTDTVYAPLTLKRYFDRWDVSLTVPYITQETGAGVAAIAGRPVQIRKGRDGGTTTNEGLGDLVLKGGVDLMQEGEQPFSLSPVGKIKFPTADEEAGLGTGEFDEGVGLEASKRINPPVDFSCRYLLHLYRQSTGNGFEQ